jgi:hypothetical protein
MKHIATFSFLIAALLAAIPAFAQITLTENDFLQSFGTQKSSSSADYVDTSSSAAPAMKALLNQSGANQAWNFGSLTFYLQAVTPNSDTVVPYPGGAADASSFPTATHVAISKSGVMTDYSFMTINSSGFYLLGNSQDSAGKASVVGMYSPGMEFFAFPLTYQTTWSSTSTTTFGGQAATVQLNGDVDSWGTLTVPGQSATQSLRIKRTQVVAAMGFGDTTVEYDWITTSGISATISVSIAPFFGTVTMTASYSVGVAPSSVARNMESDPFSVHFASNPISSATNVFFTMPKQSDVHASLIDPLGRQTEVLMNGPAHQGLNALTINPAGLANGTYFLRIESAGNASMQKVIVAR